MIQINQQDKIKEKGPFKFFSSEFFVPSKHTYDEPNPFTITVKVISKAISLNWPLSSHSVLDENRGLVVTADGNLQEDVGLNPGETI